MIHVRAQAQEATTGTIIGVAKDQAGLAAGYSVIAVKGTKYGATADENGNYTIKKIPAGNYELIFSGIGFEADTQKAEVIAGKVTKLNFNVKAKSQELTPVQIKGSRTINGIGHMDEVNGGVVYSGKKTEVIVVDSLNANTAQDNSREVLGRVPGAYFSETEGEGFPSNGLGLRGLNPRQSIEMNVRQNGYNIVSDIFGYPETYYQPPLEAVERVEVTRGAASLQFGPQFGGVINYVMKEGTPDKPFEFTTQLTTGSDYLVNSYSSIGGTYKSLSYFAFFQFRNTDGYRPNSGYRQFTGYGQLKWQINKNISLSGEYSLLRNRIQMPGGLNDSLYYIDSKQSLRARNYITTPWNVAALTLDCQLTPRTQLKITTTFMKSGRSLIWLNEDTPAGAPDTIDATTGTYAAREIEHEGFLSSTTEARLVSNYNLGKTSNTFSGGVRFFAGSMDREEGGPGSTGTDFDLNLYGGDYDTKLNFTTINVAPFVENIFRVTNKLSITPGARLEYLRSTAGGQLPVDNGYGVDTSIQFSKVKTRVFPLFGIGAQYKATRFTNIYANFSQAYRPIEYSMLYPIGTSSQVDSNLRDATGYNIDLGWRGTVKNYLNFDLGLFYLFYKNRVGITTLADNSTLRTTVGDSRHMGVETYVELNVVKLFTQQSKGGYVSIFNSFSYIDARYINGQFNGNRVEYAPKFINRLGLTYSIKGFSTTFEWSYTGSAYGDANNTILSENAIVGMIPSYHIMDWSARYNFLKHFNVKAGINNLANARYIAMRTDEYPGPGIIPGTGRTFYVSLGAKF